MRRILHSAFCILHSAFFLLTLPLLASCGPQPASPTPAPTATPTPAPTATPTETPTPTEIPQPALSEIGISSEVQNTLETQQGWLFKWDAARDAYVILQRELKDLLEFNDTIVGEVGYIDREAILHLHRASFTAVPGGEKSAFQASANHDEIALDLKSLPPVQTAEATPTATPEASQNNAKERQLGPFTLVETQNPLFAKTGILKFTDENGNTWVYSAASALPSERDLNGKKVKVVEFASLQKNEQGVMAMTLDTLHSGFPVAWLIAQGYDRPFPQELLDWFKIPGDYTKSVGYTIHFEYKDNGTPNDLTDDTKFVELSPPYHKNPKNFKLPVLDENGKFIWFFVTDEKTKESFFTVALLLPNPIDPNNPHPEETMFLFGALGTMTPEQFQKFEQEYITTGKFQENYLKKGVGIFLAQEGNHFEKYSGSGTLFWSGHFNRGSLDQLLGREGNDVKKVSYIPAIIDAVKNYGFGRDEDKNTVEWQLGGAQLPFELQHYLLGLGF